MKRRYTLSLSSDDHTSTVDVYLTPEALAVVVDVARAVNAQAKWAVDVRMEIEPSAVPLDAA